VGENLVQQKAFQFALDIISLYCKLRDEREYVLSKQLLRSGTSIGANIEEALAGQSRNDFIARMTIASKEARETNYWLRLLQASDLASVDVSKELEQSYAIIRLLTAILKTAVANNSN
jgi:four helix bundle protein